MKGEPRPHTAEDLRFLAAALDQLPHPQRATGQPQQYTAGFEWVGEYEDSDTFVETRQRVDFGDDLHG